MVKEKYMHRCLQLARNGFCNTSPNPMVGAVIVYQDKIIGEGYHIRCGEAHAEVNAINSVKDPELLKHSTIYVSLEPCSHYGKTPPCADLIIKKGIPRVVIGCKDPFSKVAGRGIQKLIDAGCEVTVGVLEEECLQLIKRFTTFHTLHRPYITLKWAESSDGYIDHKRDGGHPFILSNALTTMLVHKRRAEHDAIMVGRCTAQLDNPSLNVRHWHGKSPTRIVLDRNGILPDSLKLFDESITTFIFCEKALPSTAKKRYFSIDFSSEILPQIMEVLYQENIQSLLVEGGSILLQTFIDEGCWDEAFVEKSPVLLHSGVKAPKFDSNVPFTNKVWFDRQFKHYTAYNKAK